MAVRKTPVGGMTGCFRCRAVVHEHGAGVARADQAPGIQAVT